MDRNELLQEISMPYTELTEYLRSKYGEAKYDYFCTPECRSKNNKVRRTSEGLICHHIREDIGDRLSDMSCALAQPYEWQKKENLIYCNLLEHLILHFKICVLRQKCFSYESNNLRSFVTPGVYYICRDINDCFLLNGTDEPWRQKCFSAISDNYDEYVLLLASLMKYLKKHCDWVNDKVALRKVGAKFTFSRDITSEVVDISKDKQTITLRDSNGKEKQYSTQSVAPSFRETLDQISHDLCKGYYSFFQHLHDDICKTDDKTVEEMANLLYMDFHGYGFPQFSGIKLDANKYGAENVDHYLHNALPAFSASSVSIGNKPPQFWEGLIPQFVIENNYFYIVRINTAFDIKSGEEAFVKYKEYDIYRNRKLIQFPRISLPGEDYVVLKNSAIRRPSDGRLRKYRVNKDGTRELITATLTLSKEDFALFLERYHVHSLRYLDGCYFES